MSTTLASPSSNLAKIRWEEQYVSDGLNKKLNGIVPAGIVRGGTIVTAASGLNVEIQPDSNTGDSVYSYVDSNGAQLTFRQVGVVTLDLAAVASTVVYICLYIDYVVSSATTVEWRTYTAAELSAAPEEPYLVILNEVDVPAAGPIPAANITPTRRREAWTDVSLQMREGRQVVKDGDFGTYGQSGGSAITATHDMPFWDTASVNTFNWSVEAIDPHIGDYHLKVDGPSLTGIDYLRSLEMIRCRPGSFFHVFYAVKGINMISVGANGEYGVRLFFYDEDQQYISGSDISVTDNTLTGTFGWTDVKDVVEVPSGASFFRYAVYINTDGVSFGASTVLYFDAVRVFVQADRAIDGHEPGTAQDEAGQFAAMDIVPRVGDFSDLEERSDKTVRTKQTSIVGSILQLLQKSGAGNAFLKTLEEGAIKLTNTSSAGAEEPRIEAEVPLALNYSLIWKSGDPGGSGVIVRVYHGPGSGTFDGFVITTNAYWDGTWNRDASGDSMMLEVAQSDISFRYHDSFAAATWVSSAWDLLGSFAQNSLSIPSDKNIERPFISSSDYQLIWDNIHPATGPHIRLYVKNYGLYITSNAYYSGGDWYRDWSSDDSALFSVSTFGVEGYKVESTAGSPWTSWNTAGKKMFSFGTTLAFFEGNVQIDEGTLDIQTESTQAAAEDPKLTGNIIDNSTNLYTLIGEYVSDVASRAVTRDYIRVSSASIAQKIQTVNARWDDANNRWERDVADNASMCLFSQFGDFQVYVHRTADGSTWTTWDEHLKSDPDTNNQFNVFSLLNGKLTFTNATPVSSNPAASTAAIANTLYAKNIVKAWCMFTYTTGTPLTNNGFNMTLDSVGNRLVFTFKTSITSTYSIITEGAEAVSGYIDFIVSNKSASGFDLQTVQVLPGATSDELAIVDADTLISFGHVVVLAEQ